MQDAIDFNDQIEWLEKIEISSLTNRALTIASRLAHGIRRINGEVVQLQRATMAVQLAEQVVAIDDEKLNKLFRDFLEEALCCRRGIGVIDS